MRIEQLRRALLDSGIGGRNTFASQNGGDEGKIAESSMRDC